MFEYEKSIYRKKKTAFSCPWLSLKYKRELAFLKNYKPEPGTTVEFVMVLTLDSIISEGKNEFNDSCCSLESC